MAQQNNEYLQTPELQNEFYERYVQRVQKEALGLTGNEANALQLTEAVFAHAYEHFSAHPVSKNSEIYLLMQTNRLFATNPAAFMGVKQERTADAEVSPMQTAVPDVAESPRLVRSRKEKVQEPSDDLQGLPFSFDDVSKPFVPQMQGYSATSSSLMPATFFTSQMSQQPMMPFAPFDPQTAPVPTVQTVQETPPVEPVAPAVEIPPVVPATPPQVVQMKESEPLVFNQAQTMHWTPDMNVNTETIASTKAPPEDPSTRRSVALTIINTVLFLLTVAAVGFLLYELGVFSLFI